MQFYTLLLRKKFHRSTRAEDCSLKAQTYAFYCQVSPIKFTVGYFQVRLHIYSEVSPTVLIGLTPK